MADVFYCGGCGKWKPLSEKVDRPGRRPKCLSCEQRTHKLIASDCRAKGSLRRPAAKINEDFLRWVSHV